MSGFKKTSKSVAAVCKWLLDESPNIVTPLARENDMMVRLGDSKRLGLNNVRLFVPKGILVYRCIMNVRNKGEFLFTTREEGKSNNPAYLSVIAPDERGLNFARNAGELFKYPWYNPQDSSLAFDRMRPGANLYLSDLTARRGPHPLS